jgi:hypothetical protein
MTASRTSGVCSCVHERRETQHCKGIVARVCAWLTWIASLHRAVDKLPLVLGAIAAARLRLLLVADCAPVRIVPTGSFLVTAGWSRRQCLDRVSPRTVWLFIAKVVGMLTMQPPYIISACWGPGRRVQDLRTESLKLLGCGAEIGLRGHPAGFDQSLAVWLRCDHFSK